MAQSALTVTTPNPTPPTNLSSIGATPPLDVLQAAVDDGCTLGGVSPVGGAVNPGTATVFAAKTAAAGSGTSVDNEGKGSETVVTATSANPSPVGQLQTFSCLGNFTGVSNPTTGASTSATATHASSLSPVTNPTLTSISAGGASGTGTATATATGTGFTKQSVMWVNGIAYPTTFVSSTSLTCVAPKKATAGSLPVVVITGGAVTTASQNWTFT